jgi:uncharacterized membrane protein
MSYDGVIGAVLPFLIFLANLAGGLVIGVALVRGLLVYLVALIRQRGGEIPQEAIRLSLGRSLALALEFQLAADILGTALNPTREDLIILAVIAALRTALNYFLGRELDDVQRRERAMGEQGATGSLVPVGANPGDAPLGKGAR